LTENAGMVEPKYPQGTGQNSIMPDRGKTFG